MTKATTRIDWSNELINMKHFLYLYLPRYLLTSESERVVREPELAVWLVNPPVSTVGGTETAVG